MERLTRRFIITSLKNLNLSNPIRYERYYINDFLRVQKKDNTFVKEVLDDKNNLLEKLNIDKEEFLKLKKQAKCQIIRDSYLFLGDKRVTIKKYYENFEGLIRVEVSFSKKDEMDFYKKEPWMLTEITSSPLAFDKNLSKLSCQEFQQELKKYIND